MTSKYSSFATGQNCIAIGGSEKPAYKAPCIRFMISYNGMLLTEENKNYNPATVIDFENYKDFPKFQSKDKVSIYEVPIPEQFSESFVSHFSSQDFITTVDKYANSYEISHLSKIYSNGVSIYPTSYSFSSCGGSTGSTGPSHSNENYSSYFGNNQCHLRSNFISLSMKNYKYYDKLVNKKHELHEYLDSVSISDLQEEKGKYENLLEGSWRIFKSFYGETWKKQLDIIKLNIKYYYSKVEELEQLYDQISDMKFAMSKFVDDLKACIREQCKDKDLAKIEIFYC